MMGSFFTYVVMRVCVTIQAILRWNRARSFPTSLTNRRGSPPLFHVVIESCHRLDSRHGSAAARCSLPFSLATASVTKNSRSVRVCLRCDECLAAGSKYDRSGSFWPTFKFSPSVGRGRSRLVMNNDQGKNFPTGHHL